MIKITTEYLGPTDTTASRIRAHGGGRWSTVLYDHELNDNRNHHAALTALCDKLGVAVPPVNDYVEAGGKRLWVVW